MDVNLRGATAPSLLICPPSEAQAVYGMAALLDTFDEDRPRRNRRAFEENVIPLERRGRVKVGRAPGGSLMGPVAAATEAGMSAGADEAPILVHLALSLMGPHHPDLVDLVTRAIAEAHANIEDSRMTLLGAEFAMLILVSVESRRQPQLCKALEEISRRFSLGLLVRETSRTAPRPVGVGLEIELTGLDHEGIVRALTRYLAEQGLEVEDLEARVSPPRGAQIPRASVSLKVQAPPDVCLQEVEEGLQQIAAAQHVDLEFRPTDPQPVRTPAWECVLSL